MGNFVHHLSGGIVAGAACGAVSYYNLHVPATDAAAFAGVGQGEVYGYDRV